jgi:ubiquinone/menaquinone biosynthesis C-methylase UbiE
MKTSEVSQYLVDNYKDYYEEGNNPEGDAEWRRIGAIPKVDNIARLCTNVPHDTILEVGAGEGSVLQRLSEVGFAQSLHAIDISPSGIEKIKQKHIPLLKECQLYDGYHIPYADNHFDVVVLTHVVEHLEHPRQLIREASRVGKRLFIEVPLEQNLKTPKDFVFDRVGHINFYTPQTIRHLLQSCDLIVDDQVVAIHSKDVHIASQGKRGAIDYEIKKYLLKFLPSLAVSLFTYNSALICRKAAG